MHSCFPALRISAIVCAAAVVLAGCGGGGEDGPSDASRSDPGSLEHVDGTVAANGDQVTVTPPKGEPTTLDAGNSLEGAAVRALQASGSEARVTYRESAKGKPVAVSIAAAPKIDTSLASYEGTVETVSADTIVIAGDDGKRTFAIGERDRASFDTAHLKEHGAEGEPVRVFYRAGPGGRDSAVAYEDA